MAKKQKLNEAYSLIVGSSQAGPAKGDKAPSPVGVALTREELTRISEIAKELGQSRHAILQYAIRDFIRRYDQGERPQTEAKTIIKLK